ncbi:MAG: hypothetical protein MI922_17315 [Bacteroidales bacterium]|nr:hypothetical protein [Bacteroidales bacterium]
MTTAKQVYITYSKSGAAKSIGIERWIKDFVVNIQVSLTRILKSQPVYCVKGEDFEEHNYKAELQRSSLCIVIMHQEFDDDESYKEELSEISKLINHEFKVIQICQTPILKSQNSSILTDVISYDFYDYNAINKKVNTYKFIGEDSGKAWGKLLDVAYSIKDVYSASMKVSERDKTVYLGETTVDQKHNRDELIRELQHFGYHVLPKGALSREKDLLEEQVFQLLSQSSIIIQMMGAQYGTVVEGTSKSFIDYQNELIKKHLSNNTNGLMHRIIWIPTGMHQVDQRQKIYLQRLRREDLSAETEIVEAPIEVFKTFLHDRLSVKKQEPEKKEQQSVYFIFEEKSRYKVQSYLSVVQKEGFELLFLDPYVHGNIFTKHLEFLRKADFVVIFEGEKNLFWLRSKIRDLIKAPGIGRKNAFEQIGILTDRRIEVKDLELLGNKLEFINDNEEAFVKYLQNLRETNDNQ